MLTPLQVIASPLLIVIAFVTLLLLGVLFYVVYRVLKYANRSSN